MANPLTAYLSYEIAAVELENFSLAIVLFVASVMLIWLFRLVIISRLKALSARTETELDDAVIKAIEAVGWPLYVLVALYVALRPIAIAVPESVSRALWYIILIVAPFYVVRAAQQLIDAGASHLVKKREALQENTAIIDLLGRLAKILLWVIAVLLVLSNLGYNVSTLLAGLGIGGLAIAIALQSVLADIFAAFTIYFDKPFQAGDFITFSGEKGTVKHIGIKSTRIQTLDGDELVVSNKKLTDAMVHNYKHMERRRIVFSFGVTYDTPVVKLKKIPGFVREILATLPVVELDRVHFKQLGDFSLNFEVAYYVNDPAYAVYMDTQQAINLELMKALKKEKIEFAFPTQKLYVSKD